MQYMSVKTKFNEINNKIAVDSCGHTGIVVHNFPQLVLKCIIALVSCLSHII